MLPYVWFSAADETADGAIAGENANMAKKYNKYRKKTHAKQKTRQCAFLECVWHVFNKLSIVLC